MDCWRKVCTCLFLLIRKELTTSIEEDFEDFEKYKKHKEESALEKVLKQILLLETNEIKELHELLRRRAHGPAVAFKFYLGKLERLIKLDLLDSQQVDITASFVDAAGNNTEDTNALNVSGFDAALLTVTTNGDVLTVVANGPIGTTTVNVDDGAGASGSIDVNVTAGPASSIVLTPGDPTPKV